MPTESAIIPAAVGVDIGCGMMAVETTLDGEPAARLRCGRCARAIERAVPHGRTANGGRGDRGAWHDAAGGDRRRVGASSRPATRELVDKHPKLGQGNDVNHLGTLGTGNHFIEVCLDERDRVWFMLHSGSRGVGNRIGTYFIELAKQRHEAPHRRTCPTRISRTSRRAPRTSTTTSRRSAGRSTTRATNRELMMARGDRRGARRRSRLPAFALGELAVNCHHNYVAREHHFGKDVFVTRKGAVRARLGDLGIIPGSMGAKSFIVRGKGNARVVLLVQPRRRPRDVARRGQAAVLRRGSRAGRPRASSAARTPSVIDETPMAYKPIDAVMAAQATWSRSCTRCGRSCA